jgi:hypothetical protein
MKKIASLIVFLIFASNFSVEAQTLIDGKIESGGYGAIVLKFGKLYDQNSIFVGGQGGWLINHTFVLGVGGYGLINDIKIYPVNPEKIIYLNIGYGGLFLEYIISPKKLVHFNVNSLLGAGKVHYEEKIYDEEFAQETHPKSDVFFVIEPGFNLMLNFQKNIRIGVGISYRYTNGIHHEDLPNPQILDLSGVTFQLVLKFGSF